jgi:3-isopropylmalate dehydrogenase
MSPHVVLLPGDGIGPDVVAEGVRVLKAVADRRHQSFSFVEHLIGGCSIERHGTSVTEAVLKDCCNADAVLLGAVGGPKWDNPLASVRPEQGLLLLRKELGAFANLRPVKVRPALADISPLKPDRLEGVDILFVRELTGGLYFGTPKKRERTAEGIMRGVDTLEYFDYEIRRVVEMAFQLAAGRRGKVTSVDKANILETSRLWRQIVIEVATKHPAIQIDHMLVDTASMRLLTNPAGFDVMVTDNMFGDILTDESSVLAGSMGMLPSASLGEKGPGLYEPIHGSAPDIAGKGIANPLGTILSVALMLRYSFHMEDAAQEIERAVDQTLGHGYRTADIALAGAKAVSTKEMTNAVLQELPL